MYNRYIPSADGTYRRQIVHAQPEPAEAPPPPAAKMPQKPLKAQAPQQLFPSFRLDSGDLLVLLILLLILTDGEDGDPLTILVTLAAFILLQ